MNPKIFKDEEPLDPVIKRGGYSVGAKIIAYTAIGIFLLCNTAWQLYAITYISLNATHPLYYIVCTGVVGVSSGVGGFLFGTFIMNAYNKVKWHNEDNK